MKAGSSEARVPRVLYVTRKYPPAVGGMETLAQEVFAGLKQMTDRPLLLSLGASQKNLVWFLPFAGLKTAWLLARRRVTHVVVGDAVTYMALYPFLRIGRPSVSVMVMGLDLTFSRSAYQRVLRVVLPAADRVVPISDASAVQARLLGVAPEKVHVLHPGVDAPPPLSEEDRSQIRAELCRVLGLDGSAFLVLTLGRLVRRKGVRWFVEEVMPKLPAEAIYLVAGSGPERDALRAAIHRSGGAGRVRMLGRVDVAMRERLLSGADVLLMPNVPVPGDMEGFGLVAVEAALRGTPVVASRLEGIRDAVRDGETGWLCEPLDAGAFVERILTCIRDRVALREHARHFQFQAREVYSSQAMTSKMIAALGLGRS